jgi:hypothetical protein
MDVVASSVEALIFPKKIQHKYLNLLELMWMLLIGQ